MILICYDGSLDARAAIVGAGRVLSGHPAVVLTVWEPLSEVLARTLGGGGLVVALGSRQDADEESQKAAAETAAEGTELARAAGFDASGRTTAQCGSISDTIIGQADRANATAIIMGSRGRTGLQALIGSVSHGVVQRADTAVMVVPSGDVAAERRRRLHATAHE